jgi:drug/metabolite transporter (DMT)-like permease
MRALSPITSGVVLAVASALAFGVTTPLIAAFGANTGPLVTAALLYAGAAAASVIVSPFATSSGHSLTPREFPRLIAVAGFGAALAPALLVWGLARAGATASSLVLNLEAVFTVLLARLVHREHIGRRVALAVAVILAGGMLVALDQAQSFGAVQFVGLVAVLGATVSWAADNTLTRALADIEPGQVVAAKGALGAIATTALALVLGERAPALRPALLLVLCGATGYGLSLRLYLLAQRRIGAARTGSVFATGPFVGAALAWLLGDRHAGPLTALGAATLGVGVLLHLTERHSHRHIHVSVEHDHPHRHDDGHHDHRHDPPVEGEHTHAHRHERTEHEHDHAPDIHHEHTH